LFELSKAKSSRHHTTTHRPASQTTAPRTSKPKSSTSKPHKGTHATSHVTEPAINRAHATIQGFDSGSYTATISLARSPDTTIANVPVSRAISASLLTVGATAAVMFFDSHDSADAMIVGVH